MMGNMACRRRRRQPRVGSRARWGKNLGCVDGVSRAGSAGNEDKPSRRYLVQFSAASIATKRQQPNSLARSSKLVKTLEFSVHGNIHTICIAELISRRYAAKEFLNIGIIFYLAKEKFDDAMTTAHGENWEEEHLELDAQIIYDAIGRMPHSRLGIADELFTKTEKSKIKSGRVLVSQRERSAREDCLERDNDHLKRENKRLGGIDLVVQSLAEKGGVDYEDAIMQSVAPDLPTLDSEVKFERGRDASRQHETEKGMGGNTGGSPTREKDLDITDDNDDVDDNNDNEGDENGYGYGEGDEDDYGYGDDHYVNGCGDKDDEYHW